MYQVGSDENQTFSRVLKEFSRKSTVARCAGLLTVPAFQANTIRIETMVHLAVANCAGKRKPTFSDISRWPNRNLGNSAVASAEDHLRMFSSATSALKRGTSGSSREPGKAATFICSTCQIRGKRLPSAVWTA